MSGSIPLIITKFKMPIYVRKITEERALYGAGPDRAVITGAQPIQHAMPQTSIMVKLRPSSVEGKPGSLYFQFIRGRKIRMAVTGYKVYSWEWAAETESFLLDTADSVRAHYLGKVSAALKAEKRELSEAVRDLENRCPECTVEEVARLYAQRHRAGSFAAFADRLKDELLAAKRYRTALAYRSVAARVALFAGGRDLRLDEIDAPFVRRFEANLRREGKSPNTISFYNRNLRAIYNKAISERLLDRRAENPFADAYTGVCRTRKRAVQADVFERLMRLDLTAPRDRNLAVARDLFLMSFYLRGISFIDLASLRPADLAEGVITYTRHKTGQQLEIAVTTEMQQLFDRYAPHAVRHGYLLPVLTAGASRTDYETALRQQNYRLRRLSERIGLERPLTTYVARHSWASIARAKGFPISVISQGLGHDSERTTAIYLDTFDYSLLHRVNREIIQETKKHPEKDVF